MPFVNLRELPVERAMTEAPVRVSLVRSQRADVLRVIFPRDVGRTLFGEIENGQKVYADVAFGVGPDEGIIRIKAGKDYTITPRSTLHDLVLQVARTPDYIAAAPHPTVPAEAFDVKDNALYVELPQSFVVAARSAA